MVESILFSKEMANFAFSFQGLTRGINIDIGSSVVATNNRQHKFNFIFDIFYGDKLNYSIHKNFQFKNKSFYFLSSAATMSAACNLETAV
jgi:hypothetical protein